MAGGFVPSATHGLFYIRDRNVSLAGLRLSCSLRCAVVVVNQGL